MNLVSVVVVKVVVKIAIKVAIKVVELNYVQVIFTRTRGL